MLARKVYWSSVCIRCAQGREREVKVGMRCVKFHYLSGGVFRGVHVWRVCLSSTTVDRERYTV